MDYIHIREMTFYAYHGALEEETRLGQRFQANVSIATNLSQAGQTDELAYTINYAEVYTICEEIIEGAPVQLIETLAERIAATILERFAPKARGVRVELIKPDPPIPGNLQSVAVDITRGDYDG